MQNELKLLYVCFGIDMSLELSLCFCGPTTARRQTLDERDFPAPRKGLN